MDSLDILLQLYLEQTANDCEMIDSNDYKNIVIYRYKHDPCPKAASDVQIELSGRASRAATSGTDIGELPITMCHVFDGTQQTKLAVNTHTVLQNNIRRN